jgi:uncharacterized protein (UPF0332 family)
MMDKLSIDLSEYRIQRAKDLLSQAKLLHENKKYDGCINRSYYSIFNGIRSILALVGLDSSKHSGIISFFDKHFVKTEIFDKKYSDIVHSAFNSRQENDYEDFYIPTAHESESQIKDCVHFLNEIEKIRDMIISNTIKLPPIDE